MQLNLFSLLDDAALEIVEAKKSEIRRPAPIGPVLGTKLQILREVEPRRFGKSGKTERYVLVRCQCGTEKEVQLKHIRNRNTVSCNGPDCRPNLAERIERNVGDRFGSRTVVEIYKSETYLDSVAVCKCDCGVVKRHTFASLNAMRGKCACCRNGRPVNKRQFLENEIIGGSIFVRECLGTFTKAGIYRRRVLLKCQCGTLFAYKTHEVNSTESIHCGCLSKIECVTEGAQVAGTKLTFINISRRKKGRRIKAYGRFKCQCGIECEKLIASVVRGKAKSCGCLGASGFGIGRDSRTEKKAVLRLARGKCECCNSQAPFITKRNNPYLEVHHVKPVEFGGWNDRTNLAALCPNCHREIHSGKFGNILSDSLYSKVSRLRRECISREQQTLPLWGQGDHRV
jgi:hypothetical protein